MYNTAHEMTQKFLRPLCDVWRERLRAAERKKETFDRVGRQCMDFFKAGAGFMWGEQHRNAYFDGKLPVPKFKITVALAYEYVSIYGPHLFWANADRKVFSQRTLELKPLLFGDIQNDPDAQAAWQQAQAKDAADIEATAYINEMIASVMNWAQREQPGGLVKNGRMATIEALITGLGLLAPDVYSFPGSDAKYPRSRYVANSRLLIDPDAKDPLWEDAGYIAIRHCDPIWKVERQFDLPRGTLKGKGTSQSNEQVAREQSNHSGHPGSNTHDQITWWEIYSRCGMGPRTERLDHTMLDMFDDSIGDYAYLCVAENVDFPLNAPAELFLSGSAEDGSATDEEILQAFEWRFIGHGDVFPIWKDHRFPIEPLIFERVPGSAWPMSPLAPGLGELIAINILTSAYVDMTWDNRKRIVAYLKSCAENVKKAVSGDESVAFVEINDNIQQRVADMIQFLDRPQTQGDILQAIMKLTEDFNRRVGLTDLMRGMESSRQVRVAADIHQRAENSQIRPEKMSGDVADWMSAASQQEMVATVLHCKGEHLIHLLGEYGAKAWEQLVSTLDLDRLLRETKTTVEASELRRPNHERDTANVQSLQQYLMPLMQLYAQETTNTEPFNNFLKAIGKAMEMDTGVFALPPWQPPAPDPQQQQMMQAAQAAEIEETAASAEQKRAAAQKANADAVATLAEIGEDAGNGGEDEHQQKLRHNEEIQMQKLLTNQQDHVQGLLFAEEEAELDRKLKKQQLAQSRSSAK